MVELADTVVLGTAFYRFKSCWAHGVKQAFNLIVLFYFSKSTYGFIFSKSISTGLLFFLSIYPSQTPFQTFNQSSTKVPPKFQDSSKKSHNSLIIRKRKFHQSSTKVPPKFHQSSTTILLASTKRLIADPNPLHKINLVLVCVPYRFRTVLSFQTNPLTQNLLGNFSHSTEPKLA